MGESLLHSAAYSVSPGENSNNLGDWSQEMSQEDEFSFFPSVQQYDSVNSNLVMDNRLTQDYDDIDYSSGSLVSFHTSIAK